MADSEDEDALLVCLFGLAAQFIITSQGRASSKRRRRKRSIWVHNWVERRAELGCYARLLRELEDEVPQLHKNFQKKFSDFTLPTLTIF